MPEKTLRGSASLMLPWMRSAWATMKWAPFPILTMNAGSFLSKKQVQEEVLRRVRVRPGDVCYIPAGCVHAIGAGITLYEIQQSSDITYRFYDWDRTDAQGRRRELHLDKALDVTDLTLEPQPVRAAMRPGAERVLDKRYFTLDVIRTEGREALPPLGEFGMLTALEGAVTLAWEGGEMALERGETCFLPRECPALWLTGNGTAALSMPASPV